MGDPRFPGYWFPDQWSDPSYNPYLPAPQAAGSLPQGLVGVANLYPPGQFSSAGSMESAMDGRLNRVYALGSEVGRPGVFTGSGAPDYVNAATALRSGLGAIGDVNLPPLPDLPVIDEWFQSSASMYTDPSLPLGEILSVLPDAGVYPDTKVRRAAKVNTRLTFKTWLDRQGYNPRVFEDASLLNEALPNNTLPVFAHVPPAETAAKRVIDQQGDILLTVREVNHQFHKSAVDVRNGRDPDHAVLGRAFADIWAFGENFANAGYTCENGADAYFRGEVDCYVTQQMHATYTPNWWSMCHPKPTNGTTCFWRGDAFLIPVTTDTDQEAVEARTESLDILSKPKRSVLNYPDGRHGATIGHLTSEEAAGTATRQYRLVPATQSGREKLRDFRFFGGRLLPSWRQGLVINDDGVLNDTNERFDGPLQSFLFPDENPSYCGTDPSLLPRIQLYVPNKGTTAS